MRKRILIPILLGSVPAGVFSQIFGPTIVFDPTVAGRVLTEIGQIIKLYNTATQTYNQIAFNAGWFTNKSRWLGIATQVVRSSTPNVFGRPAAGIRLLPVASIFRVFGTPRRMAFTHRLSMPVFL